MLPLAVALSSGRAASATVLMGPAFPVPRCPHAGRSGVPQAGPDVVGPPGKLSPWPACTLRPWPLGQELPGHVHDVWCRTSPSAAWCLQVMVGEWWTSAKGTGGCSREIPASGRPLTPLTGRADRTGMPVLSVDVQLPYKCESVRSKERT